MASFKPGDKVLYVAHQCHGFDRGFVPGGGGTPQPLFHFAGDKPHAPRHYWPATVAAVNADGTCDLDVQHPIGGVTLHYPDRSERPVPVLDEKGQPTGAMTVAAPHKDAPGVRYDPRGKALHTFHLEGD